MSNSSKLTNSTPHKADNSSVTNESSEKRTKQKKKTKKDKHFASSIFLASPDPSKLPIPDFDEDSSGESDHDESSSGGRVSSDMNELVKTSSEISLHHDEPSDDSFLLPTKDWVLKTNQLSELPKLSSLPKDPLDDRYSFSFSATDLSPATTASMMDFFNEYGYVVVRDVYTPQQCDETRSAMWEVLEDMNPKLKRDDPKTWDQLKGKGRYGLSLRGPIFHPQFLANRQNPFLAQILSLVTEAGSPRNVLVSQDRFTVYRATKFTDPSIPGASFTTGEKNLHLDLNPWWWEENASEVLTGIDQFLNYEEEQDFIKENNLVVSSMGRHVQCVLNFADNLEEDGGTLVIPYFPRYLSHWNHSHRPQLFKPLPWVALPRDLEQEYLQYAHRIALREGSVLLWDQRMLHGTAPNDSYRCRLAQYLKAFPRNLTYPWSARESSQPHHPRLIQRSKALLERILATESDHSSNHRSKSGQVRLTALGCSLFGLDTLEDLPPHLLLENE